MAMEHYNRTPRRNIEFIRPPNTLKQKVGHGGLSEEILDKAQQLLEDNTSGFEQLAYAYLRTLMEGIETAKESRSSDDSEEIIAHLLYPAMQLKANGGMFNYHLVTVIADKLIQFLEVIDTLDLEVIEIVLAFHATISVIIQAKITGDGGDKGKELLQALVDACTRYLDKHPAAD